MKPLELQYWTKQTLHEKVNSVIRRLNLYSIKFRKRLRNRRSVRELQELKNFIFIIKIQFRFLFIPIEKNLQVKQEINVRERKNHYKNR